MANIIKGSDLMLFVKQSNGTVHSLAFATSHQFSISANTAEISTKDHGFWSAKEITGISWNITTDNLYTVSTFNELYDYMVERNPIEVYFTLKTEAEIAGTPATVNLPGDNATSWNPSTTEDGFYGRVYITSLSATAASGDNATFSATFDGAGKIVKGAYGKVEAALNGTTEITTNVVGTSSEVTFEQASGAYNSSKAYYVYVNGEMVPVDITSDEYSAEKQIYYTQKVNVGS